MPLTLRKDLAQAHFPTTELKYESPLFPNLWRLASEYRDRWYIARERLFAWLSFQKPMRILVSDVPGVRGQIEEGISQYSRHTVEFGPISASSFEKFDLVLPIPISDLLQAAECSRGFKNPLPLPSREAVELCDDKLKFNQRLIEAGFGAHIPGMGTCLPRPYILKKRIGVSGKECHVIRDYAEESAARELLQDPDYFCQEIVPGTLEYATHVLFANNRIVKSLNVRYEFATESPIKGQDKFLSRGICSCPYLGLFSKILRTIEFQGLCCVNYKVANGRPYILEINPRFGGSLAPYFFSFLRHLSA
jgi:hypothetical protein